MKNRCLKLYLLVLLVAITSNSFAQLLSKSEREYFVLGTLDDYMGRQLDPRDENLLDRYDAAQGPLVNVVDSILKIDYSTWDYTVEKYTDKSGISLSDKIFSKKLSEKFNRYYDFKPSGASTSDNDPMLDNKPILMGMLKQNIFNTDNEKLAFLAGVYVRYGVANDTTYEIAIANGPYKSSVCFKILQDMKCRPSYVILKDNIPVGHILYFHPSSQVKAYLQSYLSLRKKLHDNLMAIFEKARSDYENKKKSQ